MPSSTIDDEEWEEFVKWWKSKWSMTTPDRVSVETFLEWRECKIKGIDWK